MIEQQAVVPDFLDTPPRRPESGVGLILAHGAGAPMDTLFMNAVGDGLAQAGHRVRRFEFPYMAKRRLDGKKRGPDRAPVLMAAWRTALAATRAAWPGLVWAIGGKSMGGRMASEVVAGDPGCGAAGLVCLGYPFHPAGKPERLRDAHLVDLATPTLIVQGTRDPLGDKALVEGLHLSMTVRLHWLEDGDHDFKPRKASGLSHMDNLADGVAAVDGFLGGLRS